MRKLFERLFSILGVLWLMFSPFVVLISSVLTTINWYLVSNSVVQGILGFVVGGIMGGLTMGIGIVIIVAAVYLVQKENI